MPTYRAPVTDSLFVLLDLLGYERFAELPGFDEAPADVVAAILGEAARFAENELQPLNAVGDRIGCRRLADGSVVTPPGFAEAFRHYATAGWVGLSGAVDRGGQGLPYVLSAILSEYVSSANMAWGMYSGLTQGAVAAITAHGHDDLKATYLPKLITGAWAGTMNLTEPQCGTDLGLIHTRAQPHEDGSYALTGTKIFISGGDHDLTENIVHLVLARIDGAPAGVKGLSLFLVPKRIPDADGNPGARNAVSCGAIEEKMGIHGNATCVMNFDGATGWLIGEAHKGLRAMFVMMNEARLSVGIQGLAQAEVAQQNAAAYARERLQGRAAGGPLVPGRAADPLIVHADVRRMLMTGRAWIEGGRALYVHAALQADIAHRSASEDERQAAEDYLGLITPVLKGVLTDKGFEATVLAMQIHGGHGFIRQTGVEQFLRDARITMIYEGANGIQALDLAARKLPANDGRALTALIGQLEAALADKAGQADLSPLVSAFGRGLDDLKAASRWLMTQAGGAEDIGAGSTDYMHLLGLVLTGWMWLRMADVAGKRLAAGEGDPGFLAAKCLTARFFMERLMPETAVHLARITAGADSLMALPAEDF